MLSNKRFFLLDMDGTIYLDEDVFDGTLDFLNKVTAIGGKYLFVTNNSSKSVDAYVEKIKKLGIPGDSDSFLTSTDATIIYIKQNYPDMIFYAMGTKSFVSQLISAGIKISNKPTSDVEGIVISNDQELTFDKLDSVSKLLTRGVKAYIATNPDWVCPTAYGYVPDCGSFAWMLEKATGKTPVFIGKPKAEMLLLAMEKYNYTKEETVMIGDRVYTDIASGYNAGIDTILVLSGEGTMDDAKNTDTPPTYIMKNIREVYNNIKMEQI